MTPDTRSPTTPLPSSRTALLIVMLTGRGEITTLEAA
jgi:hypothetical protein